MEKPGSADWQPMASAPRDGTRVLVAVRESEQGPAEVDVVRWGKPDRAADPCWIATDSDPGCMIVYVDADLASWMPLPAPLPEIRSARRAAAPAPGRRSDEADGSGI